MAVERPTEPGRGSERPGTSGNLFLEQDMRECGWSDAPRGGVDLNENLTPALSDIAGKREPLVVIEQDGQDTPRSHSEEVTRRALTRSASALVPADAALSRLHGRMIRGVE